MIKSILLKGDVKINGQRPWDIQVNDEKFYFAVASIVSPSMGETYVQGWWECQKIEEMFCKIIRSGSHLCSLTLDYRVMLWLQFKVVNLQTRERCFGAVRRHYDLSHNLFKMFLDPTMNYSCAYWKNANSLHEAQLNKMELIAKKLMLTPGMKVLDIGCGWGSLCKYLAERYKVHVVGYNISKEQVKHARSLCHGLNVDIRLEDYRDINEKFDRVVSVGMFEHVGEENYREFFKIVHKSLTDDGLFLLHTIGINDPRLPLTEPFLEKYVFPNGILPYHQHITRYSEGLFIIEDWHNFGYDYYRTLMAWYGNFAANWSTLSIEYDEQFFRLWKFYLLFCAANFKARAAHLWQVVFSKEGLEQGYASVR